MRKNLDALSVMGGLKKTKRYWFVKSHAIKYFTPNAFINQLKRRDFVILNVAIVNANWLQQRIYLTLRIPSYAN